jgi:hypothetical protein
VWKANQYKRGSVGKDTLVTDTVKGKEHVGAVIYRYPSQNTVRTIHVWTNSCCICIAERIDCRDRSGNRQGTDLIRICCWCKRNEIG